VSKYKKYGSNAIFVALLAVCAGVGILVMATSCTNTKLAGLRGGKRFSTLDYLARHLKTGMTKVEVEKCLGKPDNSDTTYVWFWVYSDLVLTNKVAWVDHFGDDDGRYLLFYNDKLISPLLKNTEATPWEFFRTAIGGSNTNVELLLGPKPRIVPR